MKSAEVAERTMHAVERVAAAVEREQLERRRAAQEEARRRRLEEGPRPPRQPGKTYDRLGRQEPQQLNIGTFASAIPGLAAQFKPIPDTHYDGRTRIVSCPCGTQTRLERSLHKCEGACGRYFANGGHRAFSAGPYPDDEETTADAA